MTLIPSQPGYPIERLDEFFAALPRLAEDDAEAFLANLAALDRILTPAIDPWDI